MSMSSISNFSDEEPDFSCFKAENEADYDY
jgi:hypothetical protein